MKSISKTFVVGKQDTAAVMGSGLLDVLATPTMVAWMENTSILLTEEYLKEGDTTVGICINTSHEKASAVGEKITCTATAQSLTKLHWERSLTSSTSVPMQQPIRTAST